MPKAEAPTPESGADAGPARVNDRRSGAGVRRAGVTDGITITRRSLGLSLAIALTVVTSAFALLWNQTTTLVEAEVEDTTDRPGVGRPGDLHRYRDGVRPGR